MAESDATDSDSELDSAILAHDQVRMAFILRNREIRRRMGVGTFLVWLVGNVLVIAAGLSSDTIMHRIVELATVIGSFDMAAASIIAMYWGAGAFDNRSMMGGGGYGGSYGGFNSIMTPRRQVLGAATMSKPSSRAD